MLKIIFKTFLKLFPLLIMMLAFSLYGYLLMNGHLFDSKRAISHGNIYFHLGIYGAIALLLLLPFIAYNEYQKTNIEKNTPDVTLDEINVNATNVLEEPNYTNVCQWISYVWVIYTILWVMKAQYTYDIICYFIFGLVGLCWWRGKKKSDELTKL